MRNHGGPAKKILLQHDQITTQELSLSDINLSEEQDNIQKKNHLPRNNSLQNKKYGNQKTYGF